MTLNRNDYWPRWKEKLHEVIFEAETPAGKVFDVGLLIVIFASIVVICLESMTDPKSKYPLLQWHRPLLTLLEWLFTILFTIEYVLRLLSVKNRWKYATSFLGIVDLLAFLPTYLIAVIGGTSSFAMVRSLRLLRVFRVLKLMPMISESEELWRAVWGARRKIVIFICVILVAVTIAGTIMYEIEGPQHGFHSIPLSMYWATVTMTTVGYGDVVPETSLGKAVAAILILLGYALIVVPTGFISAELITARSFKRQSTHACPNCMAEGHDEDAIYCKYCGERIHPLREQ